MIIVSGFWQRNEHIIVFKSQRLALLYKNSSKVLRTKLIDVSSMWRLLLCMITK